MKNETIEYIQKTTLDFISSARSINELAQHFRTEDIPISEEIIKQYLLKLGDLARSINEAIDTKVQHLITIVEVDETFKGSEVRFFESIDHKYRYLLRLHLIESSDYDTLYHSFKELKDQFHNTRYIITDLAKPYPAIIDEVFGHIEHQFCQIHALRTLLKDMDEEKNAFLKDLKTIQNLQQQMDTEKKRRNKMQKRKWYKNDRLERVILKRDQLRLQFGITPYQKNIFSQHPELKELNREINLLQSYLRGNFRSELRSKNKISQIQQELNKAIQDKNSHWANYMICRKTFRMTIDYFKNKIVSMNDLLKKIDSLTRSYGARFGKRVSSFIHSHPRLTTFKCHLSNREWYLTLISTNAIESLNGKLKRYKDVRRKWVDTDLTRSILEFLRLHFNFSRSLRNRGRNKSPLERMGFNLNGTTLYDVIFHRLFPLNIRLEKHPFELQSSGGVVQLM